MKFGGIFKRGSKTRIERRDYTDDETAQAIARAMGCARSAGETSGREIALGLVGRAAAACQVEGPSTFEIPPPAILIQMARGWLGGDAVFARPGGTWAQAASHDVSGGTDELAWTYRVTFGGPSSTTTLDFPGSSVVHLRYSVDPANPHVGVDAFGSGRARLVSILHSNLELRLGEQASAYAGSLIPVPAEGGDEELAAMREDLSTLGGKQAFVETTAGGYGQGRAAAPSGDYSVKVLGPAVNAGITDLYKASQLSVLACLGVPIELVQRADGTGMRESIRRLHANVLTPFAKVLGHELSKVARGPVTVKFPLASSAEVQGLARAWSSLVKAGMNPDEALIATGLMSDAPGDAT